MLLLAAGLGLAAGAASLARMRAAELRTYLPAPPSRITDFVGTLRQDSVLTRSGDTLLRVRLRSASSRTQGLSGMARADVLVLCAGDYSFAMGERIRVRSSLRPFQSEGSETLLARASRDRIERMGYSSRAWELRAQAREAAQRALSRTGYPASALLEALITGSREDVPADLSEGFRRTGTLHVLALSGLHVGIIYGLVLAALSFLRARAARIGIACAVVVVYQVFAGFMPSLSRATLMILAAALASALDRDREPLNLLALSGIVILAVDPFQAFSVSFQLSYLALAGILAIGPLVQRPLAGHVPRVLLAPLAASIGAQVATLPVVITVFGAWYPSGILAGIVLVPLVTVFLGLGLGWLVLSPLLAQGPVQAACAAVFGALYRVIEGTATTLGRLPGIVPGPGSAAIIAAIAGLLAAAAGLLLPLRLAPIPAGPDSRGGVSWLTR